jgi:Zn-finger nucleic acid-binding protein
MTEPKQRCVLCALVWLDKSKIVKVITHEKTTQLASCVKQNNFHYVLLRDLFFDSNGEMTLKNLACKLSGK